APRAARVSTPPSSSAMRARGPLRVGFRADAPRGIAVDPEVAEAVRSTARRLEQLGHRVEEAHPEALDDPAHVGFYVNVVSANVARALDAWASRVGRPIDAG